MSHLTYRKIQIGPPDQASVQDVIVLHGIGSSQDDLVPFIESLNVPGNYFFIQGPFTYGPSGYAFFEVNFTSSGPIHNKEQAQVSIELLYQWVLASKASGVLKSDAKTCFLGFSQGAIMSYAMAMAHPDCVDKVIGLNGRVLKEIVAQKPALPGKKIKIFALYGLNDQVQPISMGHEAKARLALDWVDLVYYESQCAHEITLESAEFAKSALLS